MEDNLIENTPAISFEIPKDKQKYTKKICSNGSITLNEKKEILASYLEKDVKEIEAILTEFGIELTESQFSAAKIHTLKNSKKYIISSAQTASPVNVAFLDNIKTYAEYIDAEIGIIATRYRNPTSVWAEEGDVWDVLTHPYLTANRQFLNDNKNILLLADLKIQATSPNPTNGLEVFGDDASVIVGSPRIEMRSVPTLPTQQQKFLFSTGSVTVPSFTDTVAGGKAEAHHSYGFVVVEIESETVIHIRNVSADDDGNFNDLIYRVEDGEVSKESVETLVWGDSHFAQKEQRITDAFRELCFDLEIEVSVLHDVWDSESINVHNFKNPIVQHELMKQGRDSLENELEQMYEELDWFQENMSETFVIASNHDDMLDRALVQNDWRNNLKNAEIFVKMLSLKLSSEAPDGIIPYYINDMYTNIIALGLNDSYIKNGVELAIHGHKGPNGSRGSAQAFSKLSHKTIIGHAHSPSIKWGCYQVGISCGMQHGYNQGLSGWAYAGCTLNKHGKRQMIILNKETLTYTTLY